MPEITKKYTIQSKQSDGSMTTMHPETDADIVKYDNATSGLSSTNTKGAIDELKSMVDSVPDIPTPSATNNGQVLSVQNGVYTLVNQDTGFYYVYLQNMTSSGGTIDEDTFNSLVDDKCIGLYYDDGDYKMYFSKITGSIIDFPIFYRIQPIGSGESLELFLAVIAATNVIIGSVTYTQPQIATSTTAGLVKPVSKTSAMTQFVGVDSNGLLYTQPSNTPNPSASEANNVLGVTSSGTYDFVKTSEVASSGQSTPSSDLIIGGLFFTDI